MSTTNDNAESERLRRRRIYEAQYRASHKDQRTESQRLYRLNNKEKLAARRHDPNVMARDAAKSKEYRVRNKEAIKKWADDWVKRNPVRRWVLSTRSNHKLRGHDVRVTPQELFDFVGTNPKCGYCDMPLSFAARNGASCRKTPSLDRIGNEKFVSINNIRLVCMGCNQTKGTRTHEAFVEYCGLIWKKHSSEYQKAEQRLKTLLEEYEKLLTIVETNLGPQDEACQALAAIKEAT